MPYSVQLNCYIMASVIRLYRRFYRVVSDGISDSSSLINPIVISANCYIKDTSTLIEAVSVIYQESTGIYYVELNPSLYSFENVYDLKWTVQYSDAPISKTLITSFKLNPISISGNVDIEMVQSDSYEIEVAQNDTYEIEIIS